MGIIPGGDSAPGRSGSKTIRRELLDEAVLSVQAGESISIENLSYIGPIYYSAYHLVANQLVANDVHIEK